MKMLTFFLIFSLFAFRVTGTEPDEKRALIPKSNAIVKATDFFPFQSLSDDLKKHVLESLVAGDKERAKGFFSLAATCKANKKLCENFCSKNNENKKKVTDLKLKYLQVNEQNLDFLLKSAIALNQQEKINEYNDFMVKGLTIGPNDIFCDFFGLMKKRCICCWCKDDLFLQYKIPAKEKLIKKYGLENNHSFENLRKNENFKKYVKNRENLASSFFCVLCLCCWLKSNKEVILGEGKFSEQ